MFERSAIGSFLPAEAMMLPRTQSDSEVMASGSSVMPPFLMALIVSSCSSPSNPRDGLGMLPGWNSRWAQRAVRLAPANCIVLRSRPSGLTALRAA